MGFMNETPASLDDLALFAAVADAGSLGEASRRTGVPLPTLSRRMTALERDLARTLFLRGKRGYALSAEGVSLAAELSGLADVRRRVERWRSASDARPPVRITAGFWTSHAIARRLSADPERTWLPHFVPATASLDLARREADIGIRNAAPDHPWLARRAVATVRFAVYGTREAKGYIAAPPDTPSQRWLHERHGREIVAVAQDPRICLELAEAGHGLMILPTFVENSLRNLVRRSEPIEELTHESWLLAHHDARQDPPIRAAIDEIVAILASD